MAQMPHSKEWQALVAEHAALEEEHRVLEKKRPRDMAEHAAHQQRLRDHVERLREYSRAHGIAAPTIKSRNRR